MFPITENGSQENNNDIIKYGPFFEVIQFLNLYNDICNSNDKKLL